MGLLHRRVGLRRSGRAGAGLDERWRGRRQLPISGQEQAEWMLFQPEPRLLSRQKRMPILPPVRGAGRSQFFRRQSASWLSRLSGLSQLFWLSRLPGLAPPILPAAPSRYRLCLASESLKKAPAR